MRKFAILGLALGVAATGCSGHGASTAMLPGTSSQSAPAGTVSNAVLPGASTIRRTSSVTAPAGWAATATQAFTLANASDLGALAPSTSMTVRIGLQLHNMSALQSTIASGAVLTPGQFAAQFGPTSSDVAAVTSFLQGHGFTNISVEPNNLLVSATGTAAQVSSSFNTTLHSFSAAGATVYANTAPAYVPTSLGSIVVAVLGLSNAQTMAAKPKKGSSATAPSPGQPESPCSIYSVSLIGLPSPQPEPSAVSSTAGCLRNYLPSDYWRAYDVGNVPAASGISVAVMAEGNVQQAIADFRTNESADGLTHVNVVQRNVGPASTDTAGNDEWTLDMTASTGMASAVQTLYLYATTSLTDSDIALEYNHWVTDNLAKVGNSSFGGCEYGPYLDGSMLLDDEIFAQGAAQGQTMFASTGDTGSFCSVGTPNGVPAGLPMVEYPAASPYVVGVGGTTLASAPDGSYWGEAAWDAGGGGLSQFEYGPSWQAGVQPQNGTGTGVTMRGLPDIAMDGDLQTGMILYTTSTGWTTIGGTSLSSPLAAGAFARLLQAHRSLGYAAPRFYNSYKLSTAGATSTNVPPTRQYGGYHDVLTGANGAYSALPGYDFTTGMGSLDLAALSAVIGP